jgi:hypothetical protein
MDRRMFLVIEAHHHQQARHSVAHAPSPRVFLAAESRARALASTPLER